MTDKFEVGNSVLAQRRVTTVEKVYANGNFKLAGIAGQWRQGGYKAGDHGYHTPRCEHWTEQVAAREARRRAVTRLSNAIFSLNERRNHLSKLTDEQIEEATGHVLAALALAKEQSQ